MKCKQTAALHVVSNYNFRQLYYYTYVANRTDVNIGQDLCNKNTPYPEVCRLTSNSKGVLLLYNKSSPCTFLPSYINPIVSVIVSRYMYYGCC